MLSLVDTMVGRPLREVLSGLAVHRRVQDALVGDQGPLAPALRLVSAWQRGDWDGVDRARRDCPVDESFLDQAYADSLVWAEAITPS
jgi:c-di-GMP-related signal transduction protein